MGWDSKSVGDAVFCGGRLESLSSALRPSRATPGLLRVPQMISSSLTSMSLGSLDIHFCVFFFSSCRIDSVFSISSAQVLFVVHLPTGESMYSLDYQVFIWDYTMTRGRREPEGGPTASLPNGVGDVIDVWFDGEDDE